MKAWRGQYPVRLIAQVLEVSHAGFYAWLKRPPSPRAQEEERLKVAVLAAHQKARETYGTRRLLKACAEFQALVQEFGTHTHIRVVYVSANFQHTG